MGRRLAAGLAIVISGCATGPPVSLVYRRFDPPKGGRILITAAPVYPGQARQYRIKEHEIMATVCAPNGFHVVDEGIVSSPDSITSYRLPYGQTESVIGYSSAEFRNFVCEDKPRDPDLKELNQKD